MIKERLISAMIGTLLILAFQPFGLYAFGWMRWLLMLGITACVFASCVLSEYVLRYVFRMPYNREAGMSYNVRRNMAFQVINTLMMTASVAVFLDRFACNEKVDNHLSFNNVMIVFASFVGASAIIGLYWKNVYWKRHFMHELADAQRLNGILEERNRMHNSQEKCVASSAVPAVSEQSKPADTLSQNKGEEAELPAAENSVEQTMPADSLLSPESNECAEAAESSILLEGSTKENVTLCPKDFVYAESDGNYVTIHYMKDAEIKKSVLRTSIKNVAHSLCGMKSITQCHRAFIVNISYVVRVESRSSGIGLKLKRVCDAVPVSKSYVAEVKRLIQNPE